MGYQPEMFMQQLNFPNPIKLPDLFTIKHFCIWISQSLCLASHVISPPCSPPPQETGIVLQAASTSPWKLYVTTCLHEWKHSSVYVDIYIDIFRSSFARSSRVQKFHNSNWASSHLDFDLYSSLLGACLSLLSEIIAFKDGAEECKKR